MKSAKINNAKRMKTENLKNLIKDTKNRIRNLYGCDFNVSAGLNPIYSEALPNEPKIFGANSSSKDLMVEHRRFELLTSSIPWKRSTK